MRRAAFFIPKVAFHPEGVDRNIPQITACPAEKKRGGRKTGTGPRKRTRQKGRTMALEWLKGILGDKYTEDIDKQVSAEIGKAFVSKADFNTKNTELKNAKDALSDANKTIEGFKSMDVDTIKKSADDWKQKAEKAEKEAAEQIAQLRFDARLDNAILSRHGRSTKGIKAMLDVEALRKSQNQDSDIAAALETLQKESGYMFETSDAGSPNTDNGTQGGIRLNSGAQHAGSGTPDYNAMSDAEYYAAVLKDNK